MHYFSYKPEARRVARSCETAIRRRGQAFYLSVSMLHHDHKPRLAQSRAARTNKGMNGVRQFVYPSLYASNTSFPSRCRGGKMIHPCLFFDQYRF